MAGAAATGDGWGVLFRHHDGSVFATQRPSQDQVAHLVPIGAASATAGAPSLTPGVGLPMADEGGSGGGIGSSSEAGARGSAGGEATVTGGDGLLRVASPGVQAALASAEACPLPGNTAVLAYAPNAAFTVPVACDPEADEQLMVGHVLAGGVTHSLSGYVAAHAETLGDGLDLLIALVGALGAMERHGIVYNYDRPPLSTDGVDDDFDGSSHDEKKERLLTVDAATFDSAVVPILIDASQKQQLGFVLGDIDRLCVAVPGEDPHTPLQNRSRVFATRSKSDRSRPPPPSNSVVAARCVHVVARAVGLLPSQPTAMVPGDRSLAGPLPLSWFYAAIAHFGGAYRSFQHGLGPSERAGHIALSLAMLRCPLLHSEETVWHLFERPYFDRFHPDLAGVIADLRAVNDLVGCGQAAGSGASGEAEAEDDFAFFTRCLRTMVCCTGLFSPLRLVPLLNRMAEERWYTALAMVGEIFEEKKSLCYMEAFTCPKVITALFADLSGVPVATATSLLRTLTILLRNDANSLQVIRNDLVGVVAELMDRHASDALLLQMACRVLWNVSALDEGDDYLREQNALSLIMGAMQRFPSDAALLEKGFGALSNLSQSSKANLVALSGLGIHGVVADAMQRHAEELGLLEAICLMVWNMSMDTGAQAAMIEAGVLDAVARVMAANPGVASLQEEACGALWNFVVVADNAERVGDLEIASLALAAVKSHLDAPPLLTSAMRLIARLPFDDRVLAQLQEGEAVATICSVLAGCLHESPGLAADCCEALGHVACDAANQMVIRDAGGIDLVMEAMRIHAADPAVIEDVLGALWNISKFEDTEVYLRGLGALDAVLGLMKRHIDVDTVCANACGVIWNFAADRSNQRYLKTVGAIDLICRGMERHLDKPFCQAYGCKALSNISLSDVEAMTETGAVEAAVAASTAHPTHPYVAEASSEFFWVLAVTPENQKYLADAGVVPLLARTIDEAVDLSVRINAFRAMTDIDLTEGGTELIVNDAGASLIRVIDAATPLQLLELVCTFLTPILEIYEHLRALLDAGLDHACARFLSSADSAPGVEMVLGVIATMRANTDALPAQRELFNALLRLRMRPELLTDGVNGRLWESTEFLDMDAAVDMCAVVSHALVARDRVDAAVASLGDLRQSAFWGILAALPPEVAIHVARSSAKVPHHPPFDVIAFQVDEVRRAAAAAEAAKRNATAARIVRLVLDQWGAGWR